MPAPTVPPDLLARAREAVDERALQVAAVLFAEANLAQPGFVARAGALGCARRLPSLVLRRPDPGEPQLVEFAPDGRHLAAAGAGGIRLWDLKAGDVARRIDAPIPFTALAWTRDGDRIVAGDREGGIEWIDAADGKRRGRRAEMPAAVVRLSCSPAGTTLLAASSDGTVMLLDPADGLMRRMIKPEFGRLFDACFAGGDLRILTGRERGEANFFNLEKSNEPLATVSHGGEAVTAVAASRDGLAALTGSLDRTVQFWDVREFVRSRPGLPTRSAVASIALSPDGCRIAVGTRDGRVLLLAAGEDERTALSLIHGGPLHDVAFSPGGGRLAVATATEISVWRLRAPAFEPETLNVPGPVRSLRVSGRLLCVRTGTDARAWDLESAKRVDPPSAEPERPEIGPEGKIAFGGWTADHGRPVACFAEAGPRVATASADGLVRIWDRASGRPLGPSFDVPAPEALALCADAPVLFTLDASRRVQAWHLESGEPIGAPLPGAIGGLAVADSVGKLVTHDGNRTVRLWDIQHLFLEADPASLVLRIRRQTGLRLDGGRVRPLSAREWSEAKPRAPAADPKDAAGYLRRARERGEAGDDAGTVVDLNRAVEIDPKYAGAIFERAQVRSETGEIEKALKDLDRALDIDPAFVDALIQRARLKWLAGKPADAVSDLDRALRAVPDSGAAYHERGRIKLETGDRKGGAEDLRWAVELDPSLFDQVRLVLPEIAGNPREAWPLYLKAWRRCEEHAYDEAVELFDRVVELDPANAVYVNDRGVAKHNRGDYPGARKDYDRALRIDPSFARVWNNLGLVLKDLGRHEEAVAPIEKAMRLDPDRELRCLTLLAECEGALGRPPRLARLGDVNRCVDDAIQAERARNFNAVVAAYGRAIGFAPDLACLYVQRAVAHKERGDVARALADLEEALKRRPRYAMAYIERGRIRLNLQKDNAAGLQDNDQAIRIDPTHPIAWNNRGAAYMGLGRYAEAIEDLSMSIRMDPNYSLAWSNRGVSRMQLKDFAGALADFRRAVYLEPAGYMRFRKEMYDCQSRLGLQPRRKHRPPDDPALKAAVDACEKAEAAANRNEYADAHQGYDAAVRAVDDLPTAWLGRGLALYFSGRKEEALPDFRQALDLWPDFGMALSNLSNVTLDLERVDEAEPLVRRGLELEPGSPFFRYHLGRIHFQRKRYGEAVEEYDRALALWPDHAWLLFDRGAARWHLEDWAGVVADMSRAAELEPSLKEEAAPWIQKAREKLPP